ncbi:MAG: glycosyltransferase family 2 protein [Bacteroidales bacterium]|nr:glycosyltransferase family 2 protein [Bacteroidales bacterium]MCF8327018.1 glycosyltransferase family 2 protein [Bacteroidales bacterium]
MMKISAAIITYNEERNIQRCLESLQAVADEIVVVDSFSEDRTKQICQNFDLTFIENPFEGHIQQKNFALDQTKYDMILSLDADEALSDKLKKSILEIKTQPENENQAFSVNRLTNYCGKWIYHSGWYPDRKVRLWNKKSGEWGGVNPHDKVVLFDNTTVRQLKGDLLHYSYYSIEEHILQINKFSSIAANAMKDKQKALVLTKMLFSPLVRFLRDYIFKGGFRDGFYGFIICRNSAYSRFLRYGKLYQLLVKNEK